MICPRAPPHSPPQSTALDSRSPYRPGLPSMGAVGLLSAAQLLDHPLCPLLTSQDLGCGTPARQAAPSKELLLGHLVVEWLRTHVPMQGTWVGSLIWEDPHVAG